MSDWSLARWLAFWTLTSITIIVIVVALLSSTDATPNNHELERIPPRGISK